jgi:hypothetical protein
MSVILNATASDFILTVASPLNTVPIVLAEGFGINQVIQIDDVEDVDTEMTMDGIMTVAYRPRIIVGKITLQANATGTKSLIDFLKPKKILKAPPPATITVTSPSNFYTATYNGCVFVTKYKGYEALEKLQEVTFTFHASDINETTLGSVVSLAAGAAGLL